jgi:hypothetical protein
MKFAFYKKKSTLLDRIICWWERGQYSHVEAILSVNDDATFTIASSVPGTGVRITTCSMSCDEWDIIEGPGDVETVRAWFANREGLPYDYRGLFGFVLRPTVGEDKGKYFCSEACATAIGMQEPWRFDPNAFADALRLTNVSQ